MALQPAARRALLPLRRVNREPASRTYRAVARFAGVLLPALARLDWDDAAALPRTGGVVVCPNHISNADPPFVGHYLVWSGRWPRFLVKASLFGAPVVGALARATGQIPVQRRSARAADALGAARAAVASGACVVVYPEGTVTHDPDAWPMTGHAGAARLALATGVPVLPLAQWGANAFFDRWRVGVPRLWPRPRVTMRLGLPVPLDDLRPRPGDEPDADAVAEATRRIMAALTAGVEAIRGARAPERRYDLRRDWAPGLGPDGRPADDRPARPQRFQRRRKRSASAPS